MRLNVLFLTVLILGCVSKPIELAGVEVRDYNGTDLSSINDFRENSIKGPQYVNVTDYVLRITGLVTNERNYSYNEVTGMQSYLKLVTLNCVEGWSVKLLWKGVLVKDLIGEFSSSANTLIFYAVDGYSTSFPLDYVIGNNILLAYEMNNVTIPPERGFPFQLVAEDKWGYKWIKWVNRIEVSDKADYEGYWERRGYSNSGSLNESMFS